MSGIFEDHPEFCARYQMRNEKDGYLYTDRFNLIVVELMQEELATKEDIACGIDKWVRLFKAKNNVKQVIKTIDRPKESTASGTP